MRPSTFGSGILCSRRSGSGREFWVVEPSAPGVPAPGGMLATDVAGNFPLAQAKTAQVSTRKKPVILILRRASAIFIILPSLSSPQTGLPSRLADYYTVNGITG